MTRKEDDEEDEEEDEEDDEEEDEGITREDIKDGLDILSKGLDIANKYKKLTEVKTPRPPMGVTSPFMPTSDEIENEIDKAKRVWGKKAKSNKKIDTNYIETISSHHWSRGEKIGLVGLVVGIISIILIFL